MALRRDGCQPFSGKQEKWALEPGRRVSERLDGKTDPTDPLGASHHHQGTEWGFQLLKTKPAHVPFIIEEDVRIQKKLLLVCPRMWDSSTIQAPSVFTRKWASGRIRCTIKREGPSGCLQIFAEVRHRQQGSTRPRSGCSRVHIHRFPASPRRISSSLESGFRLSRA